MRCVQAIVTMLFATTLVRPAVSWAGNYSVNPTRVTLTESQSSTLLTLTNRGGETLRFQVSQFAWEQIDGGQMQFEKTDDLVIYPTLFEVGPGQKRTLRIGTSQPAGDVEATYRIYIDELPPLQEDTGQVGVRVLARMGVPIFIAPHRTHVSGQIAEADLEDGVVSMSILNDGNVHVMLEDVEVTALDDRGRTLWNKHRSDWYLLAGETRELEVELPRDLCESVSSLELKVVSDRATWTRRLAAEEASCPR